MNDHLDRLLAHMAWADTRALISLRRAESVPAKALEIYAHVLGSEHVWLSRLQQQPASIAVWPALSVEECARVAGQNAHALQQLLAGLDTDDLARQVAYVNSAGQAFRSKVEDILLHIALHGTYHRGQVALLLRQHGAQPEPTDYIAFVRGVPAATRADAGSER